MKAERYKVRMTYLHPRNKLREQKQRSVDIEQRIQSAMNKRLELAKQKLAIQIERMKGASPLGKLMQGFSYVASSEGTVVKSVGNIKKGDKLTIYMTDGTATTTVEDTSREDYGEGTNFRRSI